MTQSSEREELMRNVMGIQHAQDYVSPECLEERVSIGWIEAITDFILSREKEIRLDERRKVADILDDMWCLICNVSEGNWNKQSDEWQDAALRIREKYFAQINDKKVEG